MQMTFLLFILLIYNNYNLIHNKKNIFIIFLIYVNNN